MPRGGKLSTGVQSWYFRQSGGAPEKVRTRPQRQPFADGLEEIFAFYTEKPQHTLAHAAMILPHRWPWQAVMEALTLVWIGRRPNNDAPLLR